MEATNTYESPGYILSQVMGVVGGITMSISRPTMAWEVLLVGRLVVGLTAGLNTVLVPVYVSEIAPLHLRGALGVFNQLAVTSGIFLGQILGLERVLGGDADWPWLLAITLIPASLQLVLLVLGPPSPRYLAISLGDTQAARDVLLLLRAGDTRLVEEEMEEIMQEAKAEKEPDMTILELLKSSKLRVSLVICIVMHLRWESVTRINIVDHQYHFQPAAVRHGGHLLLLRHFLQVGGYRGL